MKTDGVVDRAFTLVQGPLAIIAERIERALIWRKPDQQMFENATG